MTFENPSCLRHCVIFCRDNDLGNDDGIIGTPSSSHYPILIRRICRCYRILRPNPAGRAVCAEKANRAEIIVQSALVEHFDARLRLSARGSIRVSRLSVGSLDLVGCLPHLTAALSVGGRREAVYFGVTPVERGGRGRSRGKAFQGNTHAIPSG